ncbi:unnamed protein product, partial [marine sediment metagenome]
MSMTHDEILERFEDGKEKGKGSRIFIEGNTMYSYGYHFPLLLRMKHWDNGFLLNADKYSRNTSHHQYMCFSLATAQIPFSALSNAIGKTIEKAEDLTELNLIDKTEERWDKIGKWWFREEVVGGSWKEYKKDRSVNSKEKEEIEREMQFLKLKGYFHEQTERRPESVVLR